MKHELAYWICIGLGLCWLILSIIGKDKTIRDGSLTRCNIFIAASIIITIMSCSPTRLITGPITHTSNDTVTIGQHRFKVYSQIPAVGDTVWFQGTVKRNRINSKLIK